MMSIFNKQAKPELLWKLECIEFRLKHIENVYGAILNHLDCIVEVNDVPPQPELTLKKISRQKSR